MTETSYLPTLLALTSAFLFALSIQIQNLGLGHADPRSGALVNIGSTAAVYWLLAPFFIETAYWLTPAAGLFALVGLFRPALSANLAVSAIKIMGPTLTSGLAATAPIFAAIFAVLLLDETLTWPLALGTAGVVAGVAVSAFRPGGITRAWPLWAISLPLGAAFFRAAGHPIIMIGLKELPEPFFAGLVSYTVSLVVAFLAFRIQGRAFEKLSWGYGWFAVAGVLNGISIYSLNSALKFGQLLTVAPIVSCSPVFTILMGYLIFKRETITWTTVATVGLVVSGVIVVVMQG
jgi:drug/metabolite transporter (DMT)-like permease